MTMPLKCLVFDCDGVLLDSVATKTRAFAKLAEPYGQQAVDRFVMYHNMHGGVSRFRKFAWFFEEELGRPITPAESEDWGNRFAQYALDEVRHCPMIPGAMETLEKWHGRLPMYVCSGTPREELLMVLSERGLAHFFKDACGSPPAKHLLLQDITNSQPDLLPEEFLMIGDASTDRDAAEYAGARFYGVGAELKGGPFPWSINLLPLNDWISEHV